MAPEMAAASEAPDDAAPLHPRTTRPTRLVVAGDAAARRTPAMQPVAITPGPPTVNRRRLVRDAGGVLLGASSVLLLALALGPGGGVLGTSAEPRSPAGVTSEQTPLAGRPGDPVPSPAGSRLAPLATLPSGPTPGATVTAEPLATPTPTVAASARPTARPTTLPPPTARPTSPSTAVPTPAPTSPPTVVPTPAPTLLPTPDPTLPPPPTEVPIPTPTLLPDPSLLP
jgi:hypothetical protein